MQLDVDNQSISDYNMDTSMKLLHAIAFASSLYIICLIFQYTDNVFCVYAVIRALLDVSFPAIDVFYGYHTEIIFLIIINTTIISSDNKCKFFICKKKKKLYGPLSFSITINIKTSTRQQQ
uniref:Uncharacterized protein n=1 Tax=Rhizophora mucronata TaxID=61149 RepID=A0A2P2M5A2_RHIMU